MAEVIIRLQLLINTFLHTIMSLFSKLFIVLEFNAVSVYNQCVASDDIGIWDMVLHYRQ